MTVRAKKQAGTSTTRTRTRRQVKRVVKRPAMPGAIPRSMKRTRGRNGNEAPPAHIRVTGTALGPRDREIIAQKLGTQLGKFASSIQRTTVRAFDVNGPRGGRDQAVRIKVVLNGQSSVVVEERGVTVQRALGRAIKATTLAVKRQVQRSRTKPIRKSATPRRARASA